MTLEAILGSEKKTIVIISVILIAAGVLADFIVDIVWWTRIHPWFSYGLKTAKTTYGSLTAAWVFCLVVIIILALMAIFKFFVQSIYEKIGENRLISIVVIGIVSVLSVVIAICSIIPSGYALKQEKEDGANMKCFRYLAEGMGWVEEHFYKNYGKYSYEFNDEEDIPKEVLDYLEWEKKFFGHALNEEDEEITDYYCAAVGAPALVFALILLVGVVLFLVVAVPVLKGSSDGDNNSENENPQQ